MEMINLLILLGFIAFFALIMSVPVVLFWPWCRAALHGAPVTIFQIIGMRLRGNPTTLLIDAYIALKRAGISTTMDDVEKVYIDGRNHILMTDDLVELVKKSVNVDDRPRHAIES